MFETFGQHLKNEASVIGQVVADAPRAIFDEIVGDWRGDRRNLLLREGTALGLGASLGLLLSRSPVLGSAAVVVPSMYYGLKIASTMSSVLGRAWNADTEDSRQLIVKEASTILGREGATALETMPAFVLGGASGLAISRNVNALERMAFRVTLASELPVRRFIPERLSWIGPGAERFPLSLVRSNGQLDIFRLSEMLAERHPWQGVEVLRSIRLSDMRASRPMPGTAFENDLGFTDAPGRVMFHTHPPVLWGKEGAPIYGARPSLSDLASTLDTGIIQSGNLTTVYKGAFEQQVLQGEVFSPMLRALILDRHNRLAVEIETCWAASNNGYLPVVPRPVNYAEAVKLMSSWDRRWESVQSLSTDVEALSHPAIEGLLRLGTS